MKHVAGYGLKGLAFLLMPIFIGLLAVTWKGWSTLSGSPRLLAGWAALLIFFFVFPLFRARAGRAAMGHEPELEARRVWKTGAAALVVGAAALFLVPSWRGLGGWLAETLSDLTGVPIVVERP